VPLTLCNLQRRTGGRGTYKLRGGRCGPLFHRGDSPTGERGASEKKKKRREKREIKGTSGVGGETVPVGGTEIKKIQRGLDGRGHLGRNGKTGRGGTRNRLGDRGKKVKQRMFQMEHSAGQAEFLMKRGSAHG